VTAARLDASGPAAPPRRNGELVFEAPWQSRVFGLTVALAEAGHLSWDAFRARLIAEIGAAERSAAAWSYWACWQAALERLCAERGLCTAGEIDGAARTLAARPAGHDH
jgi:nitrile hydratase accessory protein